MGCDVSGNTEGVAAAAADLRNLLTPTPIPAIEDWLAELSVITPKRQDDETTEGLRVTAYASRLARYPADVVKQALLGDTHRFWPSWHDLEKRCEALVALRRQMIAALERARAPALPERVDATNEERARIKALVEELFPATAGREGNA